EILLNIHSSNPKGSQNSRKTEKDLVTDPRAVGGFVGPESGAARGFGGIGRGENRASLDLAGAAVKRNRFFGMPNGKPITDRMIEAGIQWAERIMQKVDNLHPR